MLSARGNEVKTFTYQ